MTFNGDQSYISIRPAARIRATATSWWEVGCVVNIELGDAPVGGGGGTNNDALTFGIFTAVRIAF